MNVSQEKKICNCPAGTNLTYYNNCIQSNNENSIKNYLMDWINYFSIIVVTSILSIILYKIVKKILQLPRKRLQSPSIDPDWV